MPRDVDSGRTRARLSVHATGAAPRDVVTMDPHVPRRHVLVVDDFCVALVRIRTGEQDENDEDKEELPHLIITAS